jgi:glycosyltransferase involved in cell wall biosynthesis
LSLTQKLGKRGRFAKISCPGDISRTDITPHDSMGKKPFLTILTASLNNGSTIKQTLESIRMQSFNNLEHIVIDGGSLDETLEILTKYTTTYNLTWISEPDQGIADALNKGLRKASGQYILVIHADDQLLTPNILKSTFPLLRSERFDMYSFPVFLDHPIRGKKLIKPIRLLWWHHFKTIFLHQGSFVHRRVFNRIGGFRKEFSIALDYDFFYRALMSRCKVKFNTMPVALMGGMGISSNHNMLIARLQEEIRVHDLNEKNPFWRLAQLLFRSFYFPYKTQFLPKLKKHF